MRKKLFIISLVLVLTFAAGITQAKSELHYNAEWAEGVEQLEWGNAGTMGGDPSIHIVLNSFEDATGININPHEIPGSQVTQYTRAMTLKESTFDTMWLAATRFFPDFPRKGWVKPLDEVVPEGMKEKWAPSAVDALSYEGNLYAIPHLNSVRILLVREDLIKEAGYKLPKTWEDIAEIAKELTVDKDGDGNIDRWGYVYQAGPGESCFGTFASLLYTAGGELWKEDGSPAFTSDKGIKTLQFLVDMVEKHKASPESVTEYREGDLGDLFLSGGAAMVEFDMSKDVVDAINKWGEDKVEGIVPPHPADVDKGEVRYYNKPIGVTVSEYAKNPEAAKHLALRFGTFDTAMYTGVVEGDTPAYLPIYDNFYFKEHYPYVDAVKTMQEKGLTETHSFYSIIQETFKIGIQSAIKGKRTPEEAVNWIADKLKEEEVY